MQRFNGLLKQNYVPRLGTVEGEGSYKSSHEFLFQQKNLSDKTEWGGFAVTVEKDNQLKFAYASGGFNSPPGMRVKGAQLPEQYQEEVRKQVGAWHSPSPPKESATESQSAQPQPAAKTEPTKAAEQPKENKPGPSNQTEPAKPAEQDQKPEQAQKPQPEIKVDFTGEIKNKAESSKKLQEDKDLPFILRYSNTAKGYVVDYRDPSGQIRTKPLTNEEYQEAKKLGAKATFTSPQQDQKPEQAQKPQQEQKTQATPPSPKRSLYEILGVNKDASPEEIKKLITEMH